MSDENLKVTFLPGIPGKMLEDNLDSKAYPDSAADFEKLLKLQGVSVEYSVPRDERLEVGYRSTEVWFPIISFTATSGVSVVLNILSNIIYDRYVKKNTTVGDDNKTYTLHLQFEKLPDGTEKLQLDGPADKVVEAIREINNGKNGELR